MSTYEPGTVAVATVRGVEGVRVMRLHAAGTERQMWRTVERISGTVWHDDGEVTNIRPLVVLDLGLDAVSSAQVGSDVSGAAYVVRALRDSAEVGYDRTLNALADQIEAQTKPPRYAEPGWGAIVVAHSQGALGDRLRWVKADKGWTNLDAGGQYLNWTDWDDLIDPVLIREGLS